MHTIRFATIDDAAEIARLLTVLEHPTTTAQVIARWPAWTAQGNAALVADRGNGTLAGFCQLHTTHVLHRPKPLGRVTALVVDEAERGTGIGKALMRGAEEHCRASGCGLLELTSNTRRADAHAFYERIGYERTSVRLVRALDA